MALMALMARMPSTALDGPNSLDSPNIQITLISG